mmetsp:Transcript_9690/g.24076  ORF Transcript_9690/g.24076 Transcript_9690/m.24076 type:complete len:249 (+) Transcript_9690:2919-3665(+)
MSSLRSGSTSSLPSSANSASASFSSNPLLSCPLDAPSSRSCWMARSIMNCLMPRSKFSSSYWFMMACSVSASSLLDMRGCTLPGSYTEEPMTSSYSSGTPLAASASAASRWLRLSTAVFPPVVADALLPEVDASARSIPVYLYPDPWSCHASADEELRDVTTAAADVEAPGCCREAAMAGLVSIAIDIVSTMATDPSTFVAEDRTDGSHDVGAATGACPCSADVLCSCSGFELLGSPWALRALTSRLC